MPGNKPARVQLVGVDDEGNLVDLVLSDDGKIELSAVIDTTDLALEVSVDDLETLATATNTKLDTVIGHVDGLEGFLDTVEAKLTALADPTTYTAITPSDSTDVTSTCTKGIFVAVTGNVNITGVGGSAVSLGTQVAGTTIPGALSRVNAATTATVFGLSGP